MWIGTSASDRGTAWHECARLDAQTAPFGIAHFMESPSNATAFSGGAQAPSVSLSVSQRLFRRRRTFERNWTMYL
jgi:hypothetical protein